MSNKPQILNLTLGKMAFAVMVTGEKKVEYRKKSKWIESRLRYENGVQKKYDFVKFTNGYGKNRPYFIAEYKGYNSCWRCAGTATYSNGLKVDIDYSDYVIYLGRIIEIGNIVQ